MDALSCNYPVLAFANNVPYVAWVDGDTYVKYWNGSAWVQLGGRLNLTAGHAQDSCSLAFYGTTPYVAWSELNVAETNNVIYVKHWNGTSWQLDGDYVNLISTSDACDPSLIMIGSAPCIAWRDNNGPGGQYEIYVSLYYGGSSWSPQTGALNVDQTQFARNPKLAQIGGGAIYVTWQESLASGGCQIYTKQSGAWSLVGSGVDLGTSAMFPASAIYTSNMPYVMYDSNNSIIVKHFNGSSWIQDGTELNVWGGSVPLHMGGGPSSPWHGGNSITFANGTPYVAWEEVDNPNKIALYVKRWNGTSWGQVGGLVNYNYMRTANNPPSIAVNNNVPYVAFAGTDVSSRHLYVKHFIPDYISEVTPNYGASGNIVHITISGSGFTAPAVAKLTRSGYPDIASSGVTSNNAYSFTYTFNLSGVAPNTYDVQVVDAEESQSNLKQTFSVYSTFIPPLQWIINDTGVTSGVALTDSNCGLEIGDADQDNTQEIYLSAQNQSLYQIKKYSYGWVSTALPVSAGSSYCQTMLADGDADQDWDLYGGTLDNHLHQYIGPTWTKTDLGSGPTGAVKISAIARADVDRNGIIELYAGGENGVVAQFQNTGTGWSKRDISGCPASQANALTAGDGNNDFETELYSANADQKIYQYKYNGSAWVVVSIGTGTGSMRGVVVGDGDNDGVREVYAACQDGKIYQSRWNGASWTCQTIGTPAGGAINGITISDADNDGLHEVYAACNNGHVYEYKKTSTWATLDLGNAGVPLYALSAGDADNDQHIEIYALGQNSHVFQFKAATAPTPTATITPTLTMTPVVTPTVTATPTLTVTLTPPASATNTPFSTDKFLKIYRSKINPNRGEEAIIRWAQPQKAPVTITVYNMVGDKIVTLLDHHEYPAGQFNEVTWKGSNASGSVVGSGIYIVHIKTDGFETYSKIAVVK